MNIVPNVAAYIHMFFLINININILAFKFPATDDDQCTINLETSSSFTNSNKNCSSEVFCSYLYSLAIKANQTGRFFPSSNEQRKTKTSCGVEKLMAGVGGCSDFSTKEVNSEFGNKLEGLKAKCAFRPGDEWDESCESCLGSWEETKEMRGKSMELAESKICSFAVLVTMVSTEIGNEKWASKALSCLGNHRMDEDSEVEKNRQRKKRGPGLYVLIGGVVGLLVVVIFSILILSKRRKIPIAPVDRDATIRSPFPTWEPALSALSKNSSIFKISIEEVYSATDNLHESNFIGEGTSGKVYRGVLSNNQQVAIKKITNDGNGDSFLREIIGILHVRNYNLVALVGYCENRSECFLLYELCPNGNLSEWLYGKDKVLPWTRRLEISIGSARGLLFLHTFPEGCIVHRDVKPTNILIGTNFEAKLSDFGLSKVMNLDDSSVSSEVRGTFGYVDPEYQNNRHVSAASDIYSFGIVLLQILSGRKVIDMNMKKPKPLDKIAKSVMKKGNIVEFADPNLHGEYSIEAFRLVFELALLCTGDKRQRPSIQQVVVRLEDAFIISMKMETSTPHTTPDFQSVLVDSIF